MQNTLYITSIKELDLIFNNIEQTQVYNIINKWADEVLQDKFTFTFTHLDKIYEVDYDIVEKVLIEEKYYKSYIDIISSIYLYKISTYLINYLHQIFRRQ